MALVRGTIIAIGNMVGATAPFNIFGLELISETGDFLIAEGGTVVYLVAE